MSMPVPPPVDPSVLGKILLIQTTIHAITSQVSIAEFICRGLEEIPGTSGVAVRIHDIVRAAPPALAGLLRNASDSGQDALQEARSGSTAQPPAKRPPGGPVVIGIRTIHRRYGAILFDRSAENVLSPYLPFLESLAT